MAASSFGPLVEKRFKSFAYLKDVYGGNRHFLSITSLASGSGSSSKDEVFDETQVLRWFYLGVSLATLLPHPPGVPFVRAVLQLLEELQYHFASSTERSIKAIRARPALKLGGAVGDDDSLTVSLQRANGKVLYEYLLTPHVAHALSGAMVAASLCDLMAKLYRRLTECAVTAGTTPALDEALLRLDSLIEEHMIAPAVKHAEGMARTALRGHLGRLDPLFARMWGHADGSAEGDSIGAGAPAVTGTL